MASGFERQDFLLEEQIFSSESSVLVRRESGMKMAVLLPLKVASP